MNAATVVPYCTDLWCPADSGYRVGVKQQPTIGKMPAIRCKDVALENVLARKPRNRCSCPRSTSSSITKPFSIIVFEREWLTLPSGSAMCPDSCECYSLAPVSE